MENYSFTFHYCFCGGWTNTNDFNFSVYSDDLVEILESSLEELAKEGLSLNNLYEQGQSVHYPNK